MTKTRKYHKQTQVLEWINLQDYCTEDELIRMQRDGQSLEPKWSAPRRRRVQYSGENFYYFLGAGGGFFVKVIREETIDKLPYVIVQKVGVANESYFAIPKEDLDQIKKIGAERSSDRGCAAVQNSRAVQR